jgi:uncharacterized protein
VSNALNWFEIPVRDLDRATTFYEALLGQTLRRETMGPQELAVFAYTEPGVGGCLMKGMDHAPATTGSIVYLNAAPSLDAVLQRVPGLGGRITTPKVVLPDGMGAFACFEDCEGNRVGLHGYS